MVQSGAQNTVVITITLGAQLFKRCFIFLFCKQLYKQVGSKAENDRRQQLDAHHRQNIPAHFGLGKQDRNCLIAR